MTGRLIAPGTVTDTTGDARWAPVRVTALLAEPVVGLAQHPGALDGPAAFGAYQSALAAGDRFDPIPAAWALDFALPLATWTRPHPGGGDARLGAADPAHAWGWACSRALYDTDAHTAVQIRRKPATAQMARFAPDAKHHAGLGPYKARDTLHPAVAARRVHWFALADPRALEELLAHVTHLGRAARHGNGRVLAWDVAADPQAHEGWARRPFPHPGGSLDAIRAPYWHPSRRLPCR